MCHMGSCMAQWSVPDVAVAQHCTGNTRKAKMGRYTTALSKQAHQWYNTVLYNLSVHQTQPYSVDIQIIWLAQLS